jgi:stage V sporulation protein G
LAASQHQGEKERRMEITEVRISPSKGGRVRAFASIVVDDCFIINDLRVMEGREGQLFVSMPARKARNGQMRDIAHPLNGDTRRTIEERVLAEFHKAVESIVVPAASSGRRKGKRERESVLTRLSSRLFTDDFWTSETPGARSAGSNDS